jgi:SAM-dependent methyltransferase
MTEGEPSFEEIYARAGEDLAAVPWASLAPSPPLIAWLDGDDGPRPSSGERALVVGCGLGDDAEALARRGWSTTGFDVSPTAIARCHERFPGSPVTYVVADLFALPAEWARSFALVVEIRTLQSLPLEVRPAAVAAIAGTVEPAGRAYVRCFGRDDDQPVGRRPWPVSRDELSGFERAGLTTDEFATSREFGDLRFTAVYRRR